MLKLLSPFFKTLLIIGLLVFIGLVIFSFVLLMAKSKKKGFRKLPGKDYDLKNHNALRILAFPITPTQNGAFQIDYTLFYRFSSQNQAIRLLHTDYHTFIITIQSDSYLHSNTAPTLHNGHMDWHVAYEGDSDCGVPFTR